MKSLYRKVVAWLARDIIQDAYQAGISHAMGQQQLQDGRDRALKEFKGKFPLLTTREHPYGAIFPVIRDDARLRRYPEVMEDAELQLQQAENEEWGIYLTTGTKPVEF